MVFMSSAKQVSGDQGTPELSKQSTTRRQPPLLRQQSEPLKCPRCASANTKFCYYNNYNKSQPRHFCKTCKRHWTKGGTLRNIPVGGGRKNKRPKISKAAQDLPVFPLIAGKNGAQNQKSTSNILYQASLRPSSPIDNGVNTMVSNDGENTVNSTGLDVSPPPHNNPTTDFQFSSLNTFGMNVSLNPTTWYNYATNLDSMEESTITGVPWPGLDMSSCVMDLPSYWNWNDIDVLNSADLNIPWDDNDDNAEIKP